MNPSCRRRAAVVSIRPPGSGGWGVLTTSPGRQPAPGRPRVSSAVFPPNCLPREQTLGGEKAARSFTVRTWCVLRECRHLQICGFSRTFLQPVSSLLWSRSGVRVPSSAFLPLAWPVLVTNRGCGVAIVQALADHKAESEERDFRTKLSLRRTDAREPKWFVETQVKKPHALYRRQ